MKLHAKFAAALVMAGVLFAAPLAAGADPVVSGVAVSGSVAVGDAIQIQGTGCVIPGFDTTYAGLFYSIDGTTWNPADETATSDGTWQWNFLLGSGTTTGTYYTTIYCSEAPVTAVDDPAIQWESAPYTLAISAASSPNNRKAVVNVSAGVARNATAPAPDGASMKLDINALPRIDKMGLHAAQADALKARVDANSTNASQAARIYKGYFGTYGDQAGLQSWINALNTGSSAQDIANAFNRTAQAKAEFVPLSYQGMVDQVFMNVFGHKADAATNAYWTAQLRAKVTVPAMILGIANSTDARTATDNSAYVIAAELTLGKPVTGVSATDAIAAPLNAQQETKVEVVENIALS